MAWCTNQDVGFTVIKDEIVEIPPGGLLDMSEKQKGVSVIILNTISNWQDGSVLFNKIHMKFLSHSIKALYNRSCIVWAHDTTSPFLA